MTKAQAALLDLKRADLQLATIEQCATATDRGIHIGGAYSALTPLTALYYGGAFHPDVVHPTNPGADLFILSKGHAVAALASVYADVGYIGRDSLANTRAYGSLIKGHPGPIVPGVPVSTGPLGHGISVSCGFAHFRRPLGANIFCLTGDGELQEGSNWEGALYAADKRLDNLCVLVDRNHGQSDNLVRLVVELGSLEDKFRGFGWKCVQVDGTSVSSVLDAIREFADGPRDGRPTAIICDTQKGFGGHIQEASKHKATLAKVAVDTEIEGILSDRRALEARLTGLPGGGLSEIARGMNYRLNLDGEGRIAGIERVAPAVKTQRAEPRDKRISYDPALLPRYEDGKAVKFDRVIEAVMRVFAHDRKIFSIDSDLANTSGLADGVGAVDTRRALNAGIAESLMMCMAEALAADGGSAWCSTFAVFFDARAFRRIGVSDQEREECIRQGGWLTEGHNLDITFVATAPNLETQTNGATHMGNDDANLVAQMAHIRIIDICCPRQLVAAMRWIAQGGKGLVYLRIPRLDAAPLYPEGCAFEYGRAVALRRAKDPRAAIISSGRGVHEALKAAALLADAGIDVSVWDMPSADDDACAALAKAGVPVVFYEHNNGWLYQKCLSSLSRGHVCAANASGMNCLDGDGEARYIHSGTYPQILEAMGLRAADLAARIQDMVKD